MPIETICAAIRSRNLIQIDYRGDQAIGMRVVEPHMVASNRAGHLALSAWFLQGASQSGEGEGWREYLIDEIADVTVLPEQFDEPRPGYRQDGGRTFSNVLCAL